MNDIADDPKTALAAFIRELEQQYQPWYDRSSRRWKVIFGIGHITALLAGVLASVLAAAASSTGLEQPWFRITLVVLPMLSSLAGSIMAQSRARELLALREYGRAKLQDIISRAKAGYAATPNDPAELSRLHMALVTEVNKLELAQANDFFSAVAASEKRDLLRANPAKQNGGP